MTVQDWRRLANPLAKAWEARLVSLRVLLQRSPSNVGAELWEIQVRVLSYLVARYGSDPCLDWPQAERIRPASAACSSPPFAGGKQPRSGEIMRVLLERIAEANRQSRFIYN